MLQAADPQSSGTEKVKNKVRDLSGKRVLVATRFWYFGEGAIALPEELSFGIAARGHRSSFTAEQVKVYSDFLATLPAGVHGPPATWRAGDTSYLKASGNPRQQGCR